MTDDLESAMGVLRDVINLTPVHRFDLTKTDEVEELANMIDDIREEARNAVLEIERARYLFG